MSLYTRSKSCYIMSVPSGYVKVGVANDVERRRGEIQSLCYEPVAIEYRTGISDRSPVEPFELERLVHQKLRAFATPRNEWFEVDVYHAAAVWFVAFRFLAMPIGHRDMVEEMSGWPHDLRARRAKP
jgi:hypothetical protein